MLSLCLKCDFCSACVMYVCAHCTVYVRLYFAASRVRGQNSYYETDCYRGGTVRGHFLCQTFISAGERGKERKKRRGCVDERNEAVILEDMKE